MPNRNIFIISKDITLGGGGERVGVNLANTFSQDMQVVIISYYKANPAPCYAIDERVEVRYLSHNGEASRGRLIKLFNKLIYRYYLSLKTCILARRSPPPSHTSK